MTEDPITDSKRVLVWDLPTRVFHWLFAGSFAVAWLTHGSSQHLDVHVFAGYLFAAQLAFRVVWGFVGARYARFREFSFSVAAVRDYLRGVWCGCARRYTGHNPAGSWAIFAMLGLGLIVSVSGVGVLGGEDRHGPLAGLLSFRVGEVLHALHETAAWAMLALVAAHLAGVALESVVHRENLVAAMVSGRKRGPAIAARGFKTLGAALLLTALLGAGAAFSGYLFASPERPYLPFAGPALPDDALWRTECGGCHVAYHPVLLPARSWERMLREQNDHFGDDLALDDETLAAIGAFLHAYAAERELTEAAWRIHTTTPPAEAPLRITETPFWRAAHREIADPVFTTPPVYGRHDCAACHFDAERGTFEDAAMRIPKVGEPAGTRNIKEKKS